MIISVHQPQYIPWLGYFDKIAKSDRFIFLDKVQYKTREYQNRNRIRTRDGEVWLTVPVEGKGKYKQSISDARIDNEFPWQRQHLNSLKAWYGHAPYFKDYFGYFEELYSKRWEKLADINIDIIKFILNELDVKTPVMFESELHVCTESTDRIIDICKEVKADAYLSGSGGKAYLKEEKFPANGIRLLYQEYHHPAYKQQYMKCESDFLPYMSVVDLLFNEGPGSREILLQKEA
jgi:hypothetical protein